MSNIPLITTIIPTYRRPKLLNYAIHSALNQTYSNLCVLVCDNFSNDETKEVVNAFSAKDSRVQYYCQRNHVTMDENFLTGLRMVQTPYYSFLSDDDFIFPWFYKDAVELLEKTPEAAMFGGGTLVFNNQGQVLKKFQAKHKGIWQMKTAPLSQISTVMMNIALPAVVFRRGSECIPENIHHVEGFDEDILWGTMLRHPIVTTDKFVLGFRQHPNQTSQKGSTVAIKQREDKFTQLMQSSGVDLKEKIAELDHQFNRFRNGIVSALNGNMESVLALYQALLKNRPLAAYVLRAISMCCKFQLFREILVRIYSIYSKNKHLINKDIQLEHAKWLNAYSNH